MFFDFVFYLAAKFYADNKEKGALGTGVTVVSALQTFNALTVWFAIVLMYFPKEYLLKVVSVGIYFIFFIYNYRRYIYQEKHSITVIHDKWLKKKKAAQKEIKTGVLLYIIISIISVLGVAIYLGSKNNRLPLFFSCSTS